MSFVLSTCQLIDQTHSPVCVLKCAESDFSRGNTRLQILHLIALFTLDPLTIRFVMLSARGRPLFNDSVSVAEARLLSGELLADVAGLKSIAFALPPQFQGYIDSSLTAGLTALFSDFIKPTTSRWGLWKSDIFTKSSVIALWTVKIVFPSKTKTNFPARFCGALWENDSLFRQFFQVKKLDIFHNLQETKKQNSLISILLCFYENSA